MSATRAVFAAWLFSFALVPGLSRADTLSKALEDELARSLDELALEGQPTPYFVAYRVEDLETTEMSAVFGGLLETEVSRGRFLNAEVRVGSPELDNTNFFTFPSGSSGLARSFNGWALLPLEDDYREIRRQAWLLTDGAYKSALGHLSRKRAVLQNRSLDSSLNDFAEQEPAVVDSADEPSGFGELDVTAAETRVRELSALFRRLPKVQSSEVLLRSTSSRFRYLNTEGSRASTATTLIEIRVRAETRAADGRRLADALSFMGRSLEQLPGREEMSGAVEAMGRRLSVATGGELIERYNGPVLFERQAAAELFLQSFAPRLASFRAPVAEEPRLEENLRQLSGGFDDRLGGRVMPRFCRLVDDPTLREYEGRSLLGGFAVDRDGVPARSKRLVEKGILKALLSDRNPSFGVLESTGNRRGVGTAPGNLVLSATSGLSSKELESELLMLAEDRDLEFGVVIRRIANPLVVAGSRGGMGGRGAGAGEGSVSDVVEAFRLYRDGRREPLRNLEVFGLGPTSFKDIVAVSTDSTVYHAPLAPTRQLRRGTTGLAPEAISVVLPSLLFEEVILKTREGPVPKPPVAPHPFFAGRADDAGAAGRVETVGGSGSAW